MNIKIVSGGRTGVDQGALEAAAKPMRKPIGEVLKVL